ncbi:hypothetical protein NDU88_004586 [Pleurodeles waltl]|uniref:Uncharacterized protein n=1 Tax=Pleurodeles waltl TaxID=8319 RepID=A0AAV7SJE1_PLEWA|nr:hypothetical protein NDU88_004586 [Pleurodeles waltl]
MVLLWPPGACRGPPAAGPPCRSLHTQGSSPLLPMWQPVTGAAHASRCSTDLLLPRAGPLGPRWPPQHFRGSGETFPVSSRFRAVCSCPAAARRATPDGRSDSAQELLPESRQGHSSSPGQPPARRSHSIPNRPGDCTLLLDFQVGPSGARDLGVRHLRTLGHAPSI